MKLLQIRSARMLLCLLALPLAARGIASGQIVRKAVVVTAQTGPGFYFGEFNSLDYQNTFSPSLGYDQDLGVKYNIASNFTIGAEAGLMRLSYDVNDFMRSRYSQTFFGPPGTPTYPGSPVAVTPQNHIDATKFLLFAQTHFQPYNSVVPYFTLGIGVINFKATNDQGDELPTNITGTFSKKSLIVPIGAGVQYFLNDQFSLHLQGQFYLTSTDYLDGYAHYLDYEVPNPPVPGPGAKETPSDFMASLQVGASFVIWQPEREEAPPPKPIASNQPPKETPQETPQNEPPPARQPDRFAGADLDSDGDGLSDSSEVDRYLTDPHNPDSDGDNLSDGEEVTKYDTSPNNPDTDDDGLTDGDESMIYNTNPLLADTDDDGLNDGEEIRKYTTNPAKPDTDDDLLADGVEVTRTLSDPKNPDTDGDGVVDGLDDCPTIAGDAANHGCPPGVLPVTNSPKVQTSGPLAGLPSDIETNDRADFSGIYFRVNTDDFDLSRPETANNLGKMLDYMKQCDDMGVVIEGHSSSEGNPRWNQQLSERRATRVRDWLLANGIPSNKILGTIGYGSALPKVPEPRQGDVSQSLLEQIRRQNRRITMLVRKRCAVTQ
jgi:outer membrane protein OmpA-like peptidoglycan-associated protein/opacity protein-like surface antigen